VLKPIEQPARVVIPSIDVDAALVGVGLKANGDMEVPSFGLAGWYTLGPAPGAAGPAVIVAHVDSRQGPDVFYRLSEVSPGDEIMVYGKDGSVAIFVVEGKEQQLKTELPVQRIWNDTPYSVLRLITCGGDFDYSSRHYRSNVIVYASLVV
jgi:sortase (surface protein transpeptidase)